VAEIESTTEAADGAPPAHLARPDLERLFQTLFEHSPDGVLITKPDGTTVRANPAACRMLGRTEEELCRIGRAGIVVPDERLEKFLAEREANGVAHAELLHRRADGSLYPVEQTSALIPAGDGEAYSYVLFRDISARKRVEDQLRRYELLAHHSRDVILFVRSSDGHIVDANAAAALAYGYSLEELRSLDIHALRAPHTDGLTAAQMAEADSSGIRFETEHRRKDGTTFAVEVSSQGATLDGGRVLVSVVRDVTERKRAEEALRDSDRRKGEFLGVLSHELRNPLAPIRNSIHILERTPPDSTLANRAKEVIRRQTEHLTRLVDDLLDVTRISRGKIELQKARVDVREIVRRTCDDHRSLFEQRGVDLRIFDAAGPVWTFADPTRLAQAVGNLLQNSAKFTPRGGSATVSVSKESRTARIVVRDTGIGVEPKDLPRMFEPFAQAENTLARTFGGLGLGLALVKGLVELHGGAVSGRSDGVGRGAEFEIALPLAPSLTPHSEQPNQRAAAPVSRLVVVIEDNVDAAQTLADLLELLGHRASVVHDGRGGIALAQKLKPDVVLCDIGLPDVSGYEVATTLRRDPGLAQTLLVALSGYAQAEDRARAAQAGFDAHLAKPAPLDALEDLLASLDSKLIRRHQAK
jgi:PAS domain S-box-containing protein